MKNVLIIIIDTARAKSFSSLGNKTRTTPALDEWGEKGMYFSRCISPAPWTTPSHASIFTGKYPSEHGTYGRNMIFSSEENMAVAFKKAGYKTYGISANRLVSSLNGFGKGFDRFVDPWVPFKEGPLEKEQDVTGAGRHDRSFLKKIAFLLSKKGMNVHFKKRFGVNINAKYSTNRAMRFVKRIFSSSKEPNFVFVNIMQPHEKYNPPCRYVEKLGHAYKKVQWPNILGYYAGTYSIDDETKGILHTLYEGEIHYANERIAELLNWMKKKGHLENTTVIITSDHGEHLGEHGHFTHYFSLYNELLHVPLIIYHPDHLGIGRNDNIVQTHDLYRTLLENELEKSAGCYDDDNEYGSVNIFTGARKKAVSQLLYPLWIKGVVSQNPDIKEDTFELASRQLAVFDNQKGSLEKIFWDSRKGISKYDLLDDWDEMNPLDMDDVQAEKALRIIDDAAAQTGFDLVEDKKVDISEKIMSQLVDLGYM